MQSLNLILLLSTDSLKGMHVIGSPVKLILNITQVQVQGRKCALHLGQVSLTAVSCGQSGHATAHELSRCTDSRTVAHGHSVQIPAGHEAAAHNNSYGVNTVDMFCAHSVRHRVDMQN